MLLYVAAAVVLYVAACLCVHRFVLRTGQVVTRSEVYSDVSGVSKMVTFAALAGDFGTAVVAREIFSAEVYMHNGIHVPLTGSPLVIDVGCNIGLFSMFVMERNAEAVVVAAEPIPVLHRLACANVARYGGHVWVERVAVAAGAASTARFVFDPRITAGASMCEADITRSWKAASLCVQLSILFSDNVRAGNLPPRPFLWLSAQLRAPVVRWAVALALLPLLVLFAVFLLLGPTQKEIVQGGCVPLAQLLARAAASMPDVAMRRRVVQGPIALLKVDVEGAEWEVLMGISEAEWRRIEQVVVEVHDIDGRVRRVESLLRERGFAEVRTTQEDWDAHEVLRIQSVFARRRHIEEAEAYHV